MSVIVATRNRALHLEATLAALSGLRVGAELSGEVLIVDNGSSDHTAQVVARTRLERLALRYIQVPLAGKATALNEGIGNAEGEVLAFIDDDVRPSKDWLQRLCAPLLDGVADMVAGTVVIAPHLRRSWMTPFHASMLASTEMLDGSRPESAVGANMAFRRDVLNTVPGFDAELGPGRLGLWEDTLFSMQVRAAGLRLTRATDAVVEHHFDASRLSTEAFLQHARNEARSAAYVAWHWQHRLATSRLAENVRLRVLLAGKRWLRRERQSEGLPLWELSLVSGLEFNRHFALEQMRPRLYEKHGTRKRLS